MLHVNKLKNMNLQYIWILFKLFPFCDNSTIILYEFGILGNKTKINLLIYFTVKSKHVYKPSFSREGNNCLNETEKD